MDNVMTGRMSQKGQIATPALTHKALGLTKGIESFFKVEGNEITIKKLPTTLDWVNLVKQTPVENVEIDKEGHHSPKKSSEFHDWMVNG